MGVETFPLPGHAKILAREPTSHNVHVLWENFFPSPFLFDEIDNAPLMVNPGADSEFLEVRIPKNACGFFNVIGEYNLVIISLKKESIWTRFLLYPITMLSLVNGSPQNLESPNKSQV